MGWPPVTAALIWEHPTRSRRGLKTIREASHAKSAQVEGERSLLPLAIDHRPADPLGQTEERPF